MKHQIKIGKYYLYIADHKLKSRSGKTRNKSERHLKQLSAAQMMAAKGEFKCELCGAENVSLQMHHLWAASLHPKKALMPENVILVCSSCHQRIHNDPFLWIDLINEKCPDCSGRANESVEIATHKISVISIEKNT